MTGHTGARRPPPYLASVEYDGVRVHLTRAVSDALTTADVVTDVRAVLALLPDPEQASRAMWAAVMRRALPPAVAHEYARELAAGFGLLGPCSVYCECYRAPAKRIYTAELASPAGSLPSAAAYHARALVAALPPPSKHQP